MFTFAYLRCIDLNQNSNYYPAHDYILKKANENLTNVYISKAGLFSQCFLDVALLIYIPSKFKKIGVEEEAAVMPTNLKWVSFMYILLSWCIEGNLKLLGFLLFCGSM